VALTGLRAGERQLRRERRNSGHTLAGGGGKEGSVARERHLRFGVTGWLERRDSFVPDAKLRVECGPDTGS